MNTYYEKIQFVKRKISQYLEDIFKVYGNELLLQLEDYNLLTNKNNCIETSTATGFIIEEFITSKLEIYTKNHRQKSEVNVFKLKERTTANSSYDCYAEYDNIFFMINIKVQKEADAENQYIDHLLEEIGKNVEVDIPEEMVDEEVDRLIERYEEQLKMQGISLDLYYQFTRTTEKDLRNQLEKEAYNHVLYRLMLEEILKLEKLEVTDEESTEEAEKLADKYKMKKDEFLDAFGGIEMIKYDLEMRKVIDFLKEANK